MLWEKQRCSAIFRDTDKHLLFLQCTTMVNTERFLNLKTWLVQTLFILHFPVYTQWFPAGNSPYPGLFFSRNPHYLGGQVLPPLLCCCPLAETKAAASVNTPLHPSYPGALSFSSVTTAKKSPQLQPQPQHIKKVANRFGKEVSEKMKIWKEKQT